MPDINKVDSRRWLSVEEDVEVVEECVSDTRDKSMKAIIALEREVCTETAKESAMAIEASNCDDKKRAVPSPVGVAEAFKPVDVLAKECDLLDAAMHLRQAKRAFTAG